MRRCSPGLTGVYDMGVEADCAAVSTAAMVGLFIGLVLHKSRPDRSEETRLLQTYLSKDLAAAQKDLQAERKRNMRDQKRLAMFLSTLQVLSRLLPAQAADALIPTYCNTYCSIISVTIHIIPLNVWLADRSLS
jgi:hypothetical protein